MMEAASTSEMSINYYPTTRRYNPEDSCFSEISGSNGGKHKDVFSDVAPCRFVEIDGRFRGSYCLHHQGDE
jgi:hypothetical protein